MKFYIVLLLTAFSISTDVYSMDNDLEKQEHRIDFSNKIDKFEQLFKVAIHKQDENTAQGLISSLEKERKNFNADQQKKLFLTLQALEECINSRIEEPHDFAKLKKRFWFTFGITISSAVTMTVIGMARYPYSSTAYAMYALALLPLGFSFYSLYQIRQLYKEARTAPVTNQKLRSILSHLKGMKFKPLWLKEVDTINALDKDIATYQDLVAHRAGKQTKLINLKKQLGEVPQNKCCICQGEDDLTSLQCANNNHPKSICSPCYPTLIQNTDKCPLCRSKLDIEKG